MQYIEIEYNQELKPLGAVLSDVKHPADFFVCAIQIPMPRVEDVLRQRASELGPPIQMCDALSWNNSKLSEGVEVIIAHSLAHGRPFLLNRSES